MVSKILRFFFFLVFNTIIPFSTIFEHCRKIWWNKCDKSMKRSKLETTMKTCKKRYDKLEKVENFGNTRKKSKKYKSYSKISKHSKLTAEWVFKTIKKYNRLNTCNKEKGRKVLNNCEKYERVENCKTKGRSVKKYEEDKDGLKRLKIENVWYNSEKYTPIVKHVCTKWLKTHKL